MQQQCPNCQNPINDTQKFCGKCNTQLKCKSCSTPLGADDANCTECGVERAPQKIANPNSKNIIEIKKDGDTFTFKAEFSDDTGKEVVQGARDILSQFAQTKRVVPLSIPEADITRQKEQQTSHTEDISHEVVSDVQKPVTQNDKQELTPPKKTPASSKKTLSTIKKTTSAPKKSKSSNNPEVDASINFYPKDKISFENFYKQYGLNEKTSRIDKILIIAFWFMNILKQKEISLNDFYTAYKAIEPKQFVPQKFHQFLYDNGIKNDKKFLELDNSTKTYTVTTKGENKFNKEIAKPK